jgi:arylsulfatase A-like enzyme
MDSLINRLGVALLAVATALLYPAFFMTELQAAAPNVVVILADDLGFSDLGCYGGEIDTPNLDRLAAGGLRFTQGYNTARCWPTRGALLTGYYAQAIRRDALPGGEFSLRNSRPAWARLLPELLASAGYHSYHSGKWHVDGDPLKQGCESSLQVEGEQNDYFDVVGVTVDGVPIRKKDGFYVTSVVGDHAVDCLKRHSKEHAAAPFFQYVAFTSPHFPLHAPQDLVQKYRARYRAGWDAIRRERYGRIVEAGLVTTAIAAVPWDDRPPAALPKGLAVVGPGEVIQPIAWERLSTDQQEFQATKLAIHAAMIDAMDQAIGRIITQLASMNAIDNTLIIFASDNGASAEMIVRGKGHDPARPPGSQFTYLCLGPGGAACANAPFRGAKKSLREGGIATPWIVHWPRGIAARGELRRQPVHVIDVVPTVLDVAGIAAPKEHDGKPVPPMHGRSFAAALANASAPPAHEEIWWCHEGNRAVRVGDWKLVAANGKPWELYDLAKDRCETVNLAAEAPARVAELEAAWNRIAEECRRAD